jgi:hypothetical protein
MQRLEQKDHRTRVQYAEEDPQPKVQFQEEEEEAAQAKVQFQEEEEEAVQAKVQFQEEEEEAAQPKVQLQEEEEEAAQAKVQLQEEEEEAAQAKVQLQEEEEEAVQAKVQFQEEEEEAAQAKVQLQEEEEEAAQAKVQFQEEEEEAVQPKPEPIARRSSRLIRSVAQSGFKGNPGSYPFQRRIQAAFGRHDIANIAAFGDAAATQANRRLSSLAYASSEKVAFRGYPDLHTAAHEAAHVIQQRRGVRLKDGAGRKGDPYERHADAVADRVVQGKSAQALLNRSPGSDGSGAGALQLKDSPGAPGRYHARGWALEVCGRREKEDPRPPEKRDPQGVGAHAAQRGAFAETDPKGRENKKIVPFDAGGLDKDETPMDRRTLITEINENIWDVQAIRTVLFDEAPRFDDIIQSKINSCYLLAVLLSLTHSAKGLTTIKEIVSEAPDGFLVKFYQVLEGGIPDQFRNYHVYVPLMRAEWQAQVPHRGPYPLTDTVRSWLRERFAIPEPITLIGDYYNQVAWAWAIEKAFASVVGAWETVEGGDAATAFLVLLGKMGNARVPRQADELPAMRFFSQLQRKFQSGVPMTATPREGHEIPASFSHTYHVVDADSAGVSVVPQCKIPIEAERMAWSTFLMLTGKTKAKSSPSEAGRSLGSTSADILAAWQAGDIVYGSWQPTVNFDGRRFFLSGHGYSIVEVTAKTISLEEPYGRFPLEAISRQQFCSLFSMVYGSENFSPA